MELAHYFATSPNPDVAGCLNTGAETDGVVFPGIEPTRGAHCFIGRQSVLEAVALLYGTTVEDVETRLDEDNKVNQENKRLRAQNKELKATVARWDAFADAARDAGLGVPTIE